MPDWKVLLSLASKNLRFYLVGITSTNISAILKKRELLDYWKHTKMNEKILMHENIETHVATHRKEPQEEIQTMHIASRGLPAPSASKSACQRIPWKNKWRRWSHLIQESPLNASLSHINCWKAAEIASITARSRRHGCFRKKILSWNKERQSLLSWAVAQWQYRAMKKFRKTSNRSFSLSGIV